MSRTRNPAGRFTATPFGQKPEEVPVETITVARVKHGTFAETIQLRGETVYVTMPQKQPPWWFKLAEAVHREILTWLLGELLAGLGHLTKRTPAKVEPLGFDIYLRWWERWPVAATTRLERDVGERVQAFAIGEREFHRWLLGDFAAGVRDAIEGKRPWF